MAGTVQKDQTAVAEMPSPEASAQQAGLTYVSDDEPGIRRKKWGRGFTYLDSEGHHITDATQRTHFEDLAIPPAWTDVWICPSPNGHLQATGRDDEGRKQYLYHPRWQTVRRRMRFDRLVPFGHALSQIRAHCAHDLRLDGLPRDKILALVVRLLDTTLIRIGHDAYAEENDSFGLTTMRRRHVHFSDDAHCTFTFKGKSGQERRIMLNAPLLVRTVKACCDVPGYEIFAFYDAEEQKHDVKAHHVNAYLKETTGEDFTAKHFRPWGGTVHAACTLIDLGPPASEKEADKNLVRMVKAVADTLGNTEAVCREHYIHPALAEGYRDGTLLESWPRYLEQDPLPHLKPEEHALLRFLKAQCTGD